MHQKEQLKSKHRAQEKEIKNKSPKQVKRMNLC